MDSLLEMVFGMLTEVIFEGAAAIGGSKKAPWPLRIAALAVLAVLSLGVAGVIALVAFVCFRGRMPLIGALLAALTVFWIGYCVKAVKKHFLRR